MKLLATTCFFLFSILNSYSQTPDNNPTEKKIAPWYVEKFKISAGGFLPVNNTSIQVSAKGGAVGTDIDFEKDLGFKSDQLTFLANFQWRISRKSRLNLNYYNIPRSSTHTLKKDITFNDKTYNVNTTVSSFFNTAIYQVSYGYAIMAKPKYELGLLIGTHLVGGKVGIAVNGVNAGASASSDFGFTAPLPDLGLWGGYAFSDRFAVNLDIDYLSLTIGNISGSIFAYSLLFTYRLVDKLDIGLGYNGLNFKITANKNNAEGMFKWGYNGPALGVTYSFGNKSWGN